MDVLSVCTASLSHLCLSGAVFWVHTRGLQVAWCCSSVWSGWNRVAALRSMFMFSRIRLFATPWTIVLQASLSKGFSRQKYWSGFPCPPPGDLPNLGLKLPSTCISCIAGRFFTIWAKSKNRYHFTPVRMAIVKKSINKKHWRGCGICKTETDSQIRKPNLWLPKRGVGRDKQGYVIHKQLYVNKQQGFNI